MSRSAANLIQLMQEQKLRVFMTSDFITFSLMAPSAAVHALRRLASQKIIARIKRGVWVNLLAGDLHPYEAVPFLRAPWPAYVSLYSALADYGLVAEIPQVIYAVSGALPKKYKTQLGDFHIHHLPANLIWGYEIKRIGQGSYPIAEPEKAFLDLVYLALTPRSPLHLPRKRDRRWKLDPTKLKPYALRFRYRPLMDYLKEHRLWDSRQ